jgi:hypothetical protein
MFPLDFDAIICADEFLGCNLELDLLEGYHSRKSDNTPNAVVALTFFRHLEWRLLRAGMLF